MTVNEISMQGTLTSPRISATTASTSAQTVDTNNPSASESSRQDQQTSTVDSVTILNKLQDTKSEARRDAAKEVSKQVRTMHNVQFAYNNKGDLRIRFTDSRSKLVYQTPPVYFTMMSDLMARPELSVNTKA